MLRRCPGALKLGSAATCLSKDAGFLKLGGFFPSPFMLGAPLFRGWSCAEAAVEGAYVFGPWQAIGHRSLNSENTLHLRHGLMPSELFGKGPPALRVEPLALAVH